MNCEAGKVPWCWMVNESTGEVVLIECRCGSWRCLRDSKRRGLMDAHRIAGGAIGRAIGEGQPVCYFTLTLDQREAARRGVTVGGSFAFLRDLWWDLRRELARHGLLGEFVFSIEQHVSGWAHANVIGTGGYAEAIATGQHAEAQADLVARAVAIGFGPQCVLHSQLGRAGLFMYLAKYLGKSGQLPTTAPKGTRRLASSRRALGPKPPKRLQFLEWATAEEAATGRDHTPFSNSSVLELSEEEGQGTWGAWNRMLALVDVRGQLGPAWSHLARPSEAHGAQDPCDGVAVRGTLCGGLEQNSRQGSGSGNRRSTVDSRERDGGRWRVMTGTDLLRRIQRAGSLRAYLESEVLGRVPWIFGGRNAEFQEWREEASRGVGSADTVVYLVGSAATGYSLSPTKAARPFRQLDANGVGSDIDIAVVDRALFEKAWELLVQSDRTSRLVADLDPEIGLGRRSREDKVAHIKRMRQDVYWGTIADVNTIRGTQPSTRIRTLFAATTRRTPFVGHRARARLYRRFEDLVAYHEQSLRELVKELRAGGSA